MRKAILVPVQTSFGTILVEDCFLEALQKAREDNIPLVVPTFSDIFLSFRFPWPRLPSGGPSVADLKAMTEVFGGARVMTLNDPDASSENDDKFKEQLAREGSEEIPL